MRVILTVAMSADPVAVNLVKWLQPFQPESWYGNEGETWPLLTTH